MYNSHISSKLVAPYVDSKIEPAPIITEVRLMVLHTNVLLLKTALKFVFTLLFAIHTLNTHTHIQTHKCLSQRYYHLVLLFLQ